MFSIFFFQILLIYVQIQSYQNMLHYHHSHTQLSMSYYRFMHIQIHCVCLIRYFRQVISLINTMKFWSIVIIIFSFQNWLTDEVLLKCVTCYNYPFTCSNYSSFCSNYSSSMLAFHPRLFVLHQIYWQGQKIYFSCLYARL